MWKSTSWLWLACLACSGGSTTTETDDVTEVLDADEDAIPDASDNCPGVANADQVDADADDVGDACDPLIDVDVDEVDDAVDNCASAANADQLDFDIDGRGDACDNCPQRANADQIDGNSDGQGDVCDCDACGDQWCEVHPSRGESCKTECADALQCGDVCCPLGSKCDGGKCALADLSIDEDYLRRSVKFRRAPFGEESCALVEGCIAAPGRRDLLRFSLNSPNTGEGDLHLGDPSGNPLFQYSPCHQHYHFESYAYYELRKPDGTVVAPGRKQAFCLLDYTPLGEGSKEAQYDCSYQGISAGWADIYDDYLPCQWVDITDVPPGEYDLVVKLNHQRVLAESNYDNNEASVRVQVPAR
jgi:hypothetical protein